jgi:hypothetical protein
MPEVKVLLDDTSNGDTWPYDITDYVRMVEGITITRGRADEVSSIDPGTMSATLDNTDGRFSLGSTTGGYGAINIDRRIRVQIKPSGASSYTNRFTGYVQQWPVSWPSGGQDFSTCEITASDLMERLQRHNLRSAVTEWLDAGGSSGAIAYYPLTEANQPALDHLGVGQPPLTNLRTTIPLGWGQGASAPIDAAPGVLFPGGQNASLLSNARGLPLQPVGYVTGAGIGFASVIQTDDLGANWVALLPDWKPLGQLTRWFTLMLDGVIGVVVAIIEGTVAQGSIPVADSNPHAVAVYVDPAGQVTMWVDGALDTSITYPSGPATPTKPMTLARIALAGGTAGHNVGQSHVLLGDSTFNFAAYTSLLANGLATDTATLRVQRYATWAGLSAADMSLTTSIMTETAGLDTTGVAAADAIGQVVNAEGGLWYVNASGLLRFEDRHWRALQPTAQLTIDVDMIDPSTSVTADKQLMINSEDTSRVGGGTYTTTDATSIAMHGLTSASNTGMLVTTDDEVVNRGQWDVSTHAEPAARFGGLQVDLLTQDEATQASFVAMEISTHVAISGLPSQAPVSLSSLFIEGWTETLALDQWDMTINTSSYAAASAWVLEDAVNGVLDSTTRLHY